MIPNTFHVFKSKEEKELIEYLSTVEFWKIKYNAILNSLGIFDTHQFRKPIIERKSITLLPETEKYIQDVENRIQKSLESIKSCKLKGGCE